MPATSSTITPPASLRSERARLQLGIVSGFISESLSDFIGIPIWGCRRSQQKLVRRLLSRKRRPQPSGPPPQIVHPKPKGFLMDWPQFQYLPTLMEPTFAQTIRSLAAPRPPPCQHHLDSFSTLN